jgi:hypothetical protein
VIGGGAGSAIIGPYNSSAMHRVCKHFNESVENTITTLREHWSWGEGDGGADMRVLLAQLYTNSYGVPSYWDHEVGKKRKGVQEGHPYLACKVWSRIRMVTVLGVRMEDEMKVELTDELIAIVVTFCKYSRKGGRYTEEDGGSADDEQQDDVQSEAFGGISSAQMLGPKHFHASNSIKDAKRTWDKGNFMESYFGIMNALSETGNMLEGCTFGKLMMWLLAYAGGVPDNMRGVIPTYDKAVVNRINHMGDDIWEYQLSIGVIRFILMCGVYPRTGREIKNGIKRNDLEIKKKDALVQKDRARKRKRREE